MRIALDGPAASGKSTAAKALAKKLNFLYIDTGAMYRAVTFDGLRNGINFKNEDEIVRTAGGMKIDIKQDWSISRGYRIFINDEDVTESLFTPEVDSYVSIVAKTSDVRKILVDEQRKFAYNNDVVMAGRDIGSNVLTDAELKIFLTANPQIRAERRLKELEESGVKKDFVDILENIKTRDKIDSGRTDNPLVKTDDAVEVDCSNLTIEEMVGVILKKVEERTGGK